MKIRQDVSIGKNLKELRKKAKLTQEQVATKIQLMGIDTSRSIYSRFETGELNIKVSELIALSQIFSCDFNDFFKDIEI
jgi:transcriptional regulator with XRE-family HTH domain